ncbi:MAG: hypothetical protein QNJ19_01995 [Woeseiaceae bacterium]|nr:hypothetical protein [Woeseiaceae bacterium]
MMDMDVQAVSGAATVAIACTVAFYVIAKTWQMLIYSFPKSQNFADSIMRESAERTRRELNHLSRKQLTYLGAGIVFILIFATAYVLNAEQLYVDYPQWQLNMLLMAAALTMMFGMHRTWRTFSEWRQLSFKRDATLSIGHGLQKVAADNGRVYHDVDTADSTIDHVVVGIKGIYGVHVIARRPVKGGSVVAQGGKLRFSNSNDVISVAGMRRANSALSRELSACTESSIKVRLVIGVPGWDIESQGDGSLLLVNERNLPMIKGWRDTSEFLLNDVVETINATLTSRCSLK